MRVVVTGGAGFIGSHLVDALADRGDEVHVVDDLSSGDALRLQTRPNTKLHRLDISNAEAAAVIQDVHPEIVYQLAASVSVLASLERPDNDARSNVLGHVNVMRAASAIGARFVFASSAAVYPPDAPVPTPESASAWPSTPYGAGKLAAEGYTAAYARHRPLPWVALRLANVYGPRQGTRGEGGVVAMFLGAMLAGRRAAIHGDGEQFRDFVFVGDVVEAALAAGASRYDGSLNISTGITVTINALYAAASAAVGGAQEPPEYRPVRDGDVRQSCLLPDRAAMEIGWRAAVPLGEGLRRTVDGFREG